MTTLEDDQLSLEEEILDYIFVCLRQGYTYREIAASINYEQFVDRVQKHFTNRMVEYRVLKERKRQRQIDQETLEFDDDYEDAIFNDESIFDKHNIDPENWEIKEQKLSAFDGWSREGNEKAWSDEKLARKVTLIPKQDPSVTPIVVPVRVSMTVPESTIVRKHSDASKPVYVRSFTLVLGDPQIGFTADPRTPERKFHPMHNRQALATALSLAKNLSNRIKSVVWLGDIIDLAEWSTHFPRKPDHVQTTQLALVEASYWLSLFKEAIPEAEHIFLKGNHEKRFLDYIIKALPQAWGIRKVTEIDQEYPTFSIPNLLGLRELGIRYIDDYPSGIFWQDDVAYLHGSFAKPSGGTVAKMLNDYPSHSTVCGHIHRTELAHKTIWGVNNAHKEIFSMSPGMLGRTGGAIPGTKKHENWQTGCGLVQYVGASLSTEFRSIPHLLPIQDGRIFFGLESYSFFDEIDSIKKAEELGTLIKEQNPDILSAQS